MKNLKQRLNELKRKTAQIYVAIKSPKTPVIAKIVGALVIVYVLSPIDLIPDFIPVLGYLDELILIPLGVFLTMKLIPKELWNEFTEEAETIWENGKPKKWYYAIPIVVSWILIVIMIVRMFFK
ncbi:MAG: DUF1232 domain-containing protein [Clostridia bacterium]|nr:DUF1232 domain-containing protein [Clostridia bacterium]